MKYQLLKHLKTKSKLLGLFDSVEEVKRMIAFLNLTPKGQNYFGGFPTFMDSKAVTYSVQGSVQMKDRAIVCSLDNKDVVSILN